MKQYFCSNKGLDKSTITLIEENQITFDDAKYILFEK